MVVLILISEAILNILEQHTALLFLKLHFVLYKDE